MAGACWNWVRRRAPFFMGATGVAWPGQGRWYAAAFADEPRNSQVFAVVVYFARRRTGPFASGSKVGRHLPRLEIGASRTRSARLVPGWKLIVGCSPGHPRHPEERRGSP